MAREWSELFITGDAAEAAARAACREKRRGLFRRLRESMSKTRQALGSEIQSSLFGTLDDETWERLEEALIMADVGASTTAAVVQTLEDEAGSGALEGGEQLSERLIDAAGADCARSATPRIDIRPEPTVIMAVGVNGTGKTTTIGKIAWHLREELGKSVLLAAADTFRAAAGEQLEGWAKRAGVEIVGGEPGSDPGAVAFEAIAQARAKGIDVVIVDTAGSLHTQDDLMGELAKVTRVIGRQLEGAPHETLLTIDATTGQNGLRQARLFAETAGVTGVVLTKLDGTARGGIALAIARELGLPVKLIGIGESVEDLRPFDAPEFARALIAGELTSLHRVDFVAHRGRWRSAWGRCTRAASICCRSRSGRRWRRPQPARRQRAADGDRVRRGLGDRGDGAATGRSPPPSPAAADQDRGRGARGPNGDGAGADRQRRRRGLRAHRGRRGLDRAQLRRRRGDRGRTEGSRCRNPRRDRAGDALSATATL